MRLHAASRSRSPGDGHDEVFFARAGRVAGGGAGGRTGAGPGRHHAQRARQGGLHARSGRGPGDRSGPSGPGAGQLPAGHRAGHGRWQACTGGRGGQAPVRSAHAQHRCTQGGQAAGGAGSGQGRAAGRHQHRPQPDRFPWGVRHADVHARAEGRRRSGGQARTGPGPDRPGPRRAVGAAGRSPRSRAQGAGRGCGEAGTGVPGEEQAGQGRVHHPQRACSTWC